MQCQATIATNNKLSFFDEILQSVSRQENHR
jgi:hypothetical protein